MYIVYTHVDVDVDVYIQPTNKNDQTLPKKAFNTDPINTPSCAQQRPPL